MGLLRCILALFVVAQHIGGAKFLGAGAVQVFFILSGYLMTSVMIRTYGYTAQGFGRFWINRILRLYPTYFVVLGTTVCVLMVVDPTVPETVVNVLRLPETLWGWMQNLTMLFVDLAPLKVVPRLSPPTWALTLELVCYFLISLGVTRSPRATLIWLGLGSLFLIWALFLSGNPRVWGYASIPSAFVPFALGGLLFHLRRASTARGAAVGGWWRTARLADPGRAGRLLGLALLGIFGLALLRVGIYLQTRSDLLTMLPYVLTMVPGALAVVAALEWRPQAGWLKRLDRVTGEMAYAVYLAHYTVAVVVAALIAGQTGEVPWRGPVLFALSLGPILLYALLLVVLIDRPVNRLRDRVRPGADLKPTKA